MESGKKSGLGRTLVAILLLAAILFVVWWFNGRVAAGGAEVGDCLSADKERVSCEGSEAAYQVVGRLEGIQNCNAFPSATSRYTQFLSRGGQSSSELTLCLADK